MPTFVRQDVQKAAALHLFHRQKYGIRRVGRILGIPKSTVHDWVSHGPPAVRNSRLRSVAQTLVDRLAPPDPKLMAEYLAAARAELSDEAVAALFADAAPHSGVMVAFRVPSEIADSLVLDQSRVPTALPPEEMHLTLAFLGDSAELADPSRLQSAVAAFAKKVAPVSGEVSGVGRFVGGDSAVYLSFDAPSLPGFRQALVGQLTAAGFQVSNLHGFTPHITLATGLSELPDVPLGEPLPLTFASVFAVVGGDWTEYPLSGSLVYPFADPPSLTAPSDTEDYPEATPPAPPEVPTRPSDVDPEPVPPEQFQHDADSRLLGPGEKNEEPTGTNVPLDNQAPPLLDQLAVEALHRFMNLIANDVPAYRAVKACKNIDPDFAITQPQIARAYGALGKADDPVLLADELLLARRDPALFRELDARWGGVSDALLLANWSAGSVKPPTYVTDAFDRYEMGPGDIADLSSTLRDLAQQSYLEAVNSQLAALGQRSVSAIADPDVLSEIASDVQKTAAGISDTYNSDLGTMIYNEWVEGLSTQGRQYSSFKLNRAVEQWANQRAEWKSDQVATTESTRWYQAGTQAFHEHNADQLPGVSFTVTPDACKCDACRALVAGNPYSASEALGLGLPLHPNCQHYAQPSYEADLEDGTSLWAAQAPAQALTAAEPATLDQTRLEEQLEAALLTIEVDTPAWERLEMAGHGGGHGNERILKGWYENHPTSHGKVSGINWGTPGDFDRCVAIAARHMDPEKAKGFCFTGDVRTVTSAGVRELGDLVGTSPRLLVPASPIRDGYNAPQRRDGHWVKAPVRSYGVQSVLTLTLSRQGQRKVIRATPEHRWFASLDGRTSNRLWLHEVQTAELQPGMVLGSLLPQPLSRTKPSPYGVAAGFTFGDGNDEGPRGCRATLWGEKDAALLPYFVGVPQQAARNAAGATGTRVTGMPRAWKRPVPLDEGVAHKLGWLAGYFAADGSVAEKGSATISSAHRSDLEHFATVANTVGIATYPISERLRSGFGRESTTLYKMTLVASTIPVGFFVIDEHRRRWESIEAPQSPTRWKVVSVEDFGEREEVFCAEVPGIEAFTLEDYILTHNCANRHKSATGAWPGHAPAEEAMKHGEGLPPLAERGRGRAIPDPFLGVELRGPHGEWIAGHVGFGSADASAFKKGDKVYSVKQGETGLSKATVMGASAQDVTLKFEAGGPRSIRAKYVAHQDVVRHTAPEEHLQRAQQVESDARLANAHQQAATVARRSVASVKPSSTEPVAPLPAVHALPAADTPESRRALYEATNHLTAASVTTAGDDVAKINPKEYRRMKEAVADWTSGSRNVAGSVLRGKPTQHATAITNAADLSAPAAPFLYRGMGVRWDQFKDTLKIGGTVTIPPSSFTTDRTVAEKFSYNRFGLVGQKGHGLGLKATEESVIIRVPSGSKALKIGPLGQAVAWEKEWVGQGEYRIQSITTRGAQHTVTMQQVRTFHITDAGQTAWSEGSGGVEFAEPQVSFDERLVNALFIGPRMVDPG